MLTKEGVLTIQNGGGLASSDTIIGQNAGSNGTVTVTGSGSTWNLHDNSALYVGYGGSGLLFVKGGGTLVTGGQAGTFFGNVLIGYQATGIATVDGAGSTWTNSGGTISIGVASSGPLIVSNGAAVSSGSIQLGPSGGSGALVINTGATVSTDVVDIGGAFGGSGTLTIGGIGASAVAPGTLTTTTAAGVFSAGAAARSCSIIRPATTSLDRQFRGMAR